jgi:hypothetical protein
MEAGIELGQTKENSYLVITIMELVNPKLNTMNQQNWQYLVRITRFKGFAHCPEF